MRLPQDHTDNVMEWKLEPKPMVIFIQGCVSIRYINVVLYKLNLKTKKSQLDSRKK